MSVSLLASIVILSLSIPFIFVIFDKKTSGREKVGWAILAFFFSILIIPFYLIKTKKSD